MPGLMREYAPTPSSPDARNRSDSAEPWDERDTSSTPVTTATTTTTTLGKKRLDLASPTGVIDAADMRRDHFMYEEEPELEDGDLPTLSLSRSTSTNRVNATTTTNPNDPSSTDGSEMRRQAEFWKQLDSPSIKSRNNNNNDGNALPEESRAPTGSRKEPNNGGGYNSNLQMAGSEESDDTRETKEYIVGDVEDTNFCDHTLSAMEAICGDSGLAQVCGVAPAGKGSSASDGKGSNSHSDSRPKAKNLNILNAVRDEADSVDEHTAIEVEYVEPEETNGVAQDKPENWSPSRKNAYLAAMARKAKEDFEKSQAREHMASSKTPATEKRNGGGSSTGGSPATAEATNDVYNSFGAAEKRKFLRLINSGMTPKESAERVRAEKDKAKESKPKKGKLFTKFWKKGSSKNKAAANSVEPAKADIQRETLSFDESFPQEEKKEEERPSTEEAPASIEYSSSSDNASANNNPREYAAPSRSRSQSQSSYDNARKGSHSQSDSTTSAVKEIPSNDQIGDQNVSASKEPTIVVPAASSGESTDDDSVGVVASDSPVYAAAATVDAAPGFTAISPITQSHESPRDVTFSSVSTTDSNKVSQSPEGRFAVSGINYYDAVRREASESETEDDADPSNMIPSSANRNRRGSRLGPILQSPKLKGFSKLSKGDSKSMEEEQKATVVTPESSKRAVTEDEIIVHASSETSGNGFDVSDVKSPSSSVVSQSEEEALGRMEDVLLRPVANLSAKKPLEANGMSTSHQKVAQSQHLNSSEIDVAFDIQEYLHATEGYSQQSVDVNESMSVMSGKSGPGSVYTQSSTLTTSSRKRRPGAAKNRLAKAKEVEKHASKPKGWHESIRAAAETNNRVWKPKQGWVGYHEPSDQGTVNLNNFAHEEHSVGAESMHLNLPVAKNRTRLEDGPVAEASQGHEEPSKQVGTPNSVHFNDSPAENSSSYREPLKQGSTPDSKVSPTVTHSQMESPEEDVNHSQLHKSRGSHLPSLDLDDISVEQSVAYSVEQFVQSVGTSSPVRPSRKKTIASPVRAHRLASTPSKQSGWVDSMRKATSNIGKDGQHWDPESGWGELDTPAKGEPQSKFQEQAPEKFRNESTDDVAMRGTSTSQERSSSNKSIEKNGLLGNAATSTQVPREEPPKSDQFESRGKGDKDPSIHIARGFPSPGTLKMTPTVNVVREKVDDEDISWFPTSRRGSNASLNKSKATGAFERTQPSDKSALSSDRRSGPVDVDEVDDMDDDAYDDEEEEGVVWNGVVFETDREEIIPAPTVEPAAHGSPSKYTSDSSKSGSSGASLSQFSKMVPRLTSSKKDTSPIRGGRASKSPEQDPWTPATVPAASDTARMSRSAWRDSNSKAEMQDGPETPSSPINRADYGPSSKTPNGQYDYGPTSKTSNGQYDYGPTSKTSNGQYDYGPTSKTPNGQYDYGPTSKTPYGQYESKMGSAKNQRSEVASPLHDHQEDFTARAPQRDLAFDSHDANDEQCPASPTHSATSSSVKLLAQQFESTRSPTEMHSSESRPSGESNRLNSATAEWKSFLGKKVQKEHDGAQPPRVGPADSLFEFSVNDETSFDGSSPPRTAGAGKGQPTDSDPNGSDYSDGNEVNKTFLQRLATCSAPIRAGGQDALAHLAFLRTNPKDDNGNSRFMPQYLCGRPDVIVEERDSEADYDESASAPENEATHNQNQKDLTREDLKAHHSLHLTSTDKNDGKSDTHSVLSEDFGAKTAYLEALAMKTAVSKPRKSDSRRRRSSAGSDVSTTSSTRSHKEKWREFLDRKANAGANPGRSRAHGSETSTAAESYAAQKVEEMMAMMAARPKSTPRSWRSSDEAGKDQRSFPGNNTQGGKQSRYPSGTTHDQRRSTNKNDSLVGAAEELAGARVTAMMNALSNDNDTAEI